MFAGKSLEAWKKQEHYAVNYAKVQNSLCIADKTCSKWAIKTDQYSEPMQTLQ